MPAADGPAFAAAISTEPGLRKRHDSFLKAIDVNPAKTVQLFGQHDLGRQLWTLHALTELLARDLEAETATSQLSFPDLIATHD
jgi:hypothetical protein